jgi:hypothetical protein
LLFVNSGTRQPVPNLATHVLSASGNGLDEAGATEANNIAKSKSRQAWPPCTPKLLHPVRHMAHGLHSKSSFDCSVLSERKRNPLRQFNNRVAPPISPNSHGRLLAPRRRLCGCWVLSERELFQETPAAPGPHGSRTPAPVNELIGRLTSKSGPFALG